LRCYFPNCVQPLYIEGNSDFVLTLHCPTPLGEFPLAIYLAMFFLGSLVRYRPDMLEELLGTSAAWLLESFVAAAPLQFLRTFTHLVLNQHMVFTR
jgi:hypothetical protein